MLDIWSWMCELPNSAEWADSDSSPVFELATSRTSQDINSTTRSIQLRAERTSGSNIDTLVTFSVCLEGFSYPSKKALWVSDTCTLSSDKPFLPLLLQLLQEIISRSPSAHFSTCPRSQLQKLKPDPFSWIMDSHSPESFSAFFDLVFVTRLFWLCVCDAPSEVGALYFKSLFAPNVEALLCKHAPAALRTFMITVGVDAELCFVRTLGYMLAKWCMLREVGVGLQTLTALAPSPQSLGFSHATEACGFWVLKGYAPVMGMKTTRSVNVEKTQFPLVQNRDSVLKYALAHQQVEAVIQVEYSVRFYDGFIQVTARVDNLRFHMVNLGFNKNDDVDYAEEKYFPSRVRVWVGPEVGANYVHGLSLGRSTDNGEKEVKIQRTMKGSFGKSKIPKVKAAARMSTRTRKRNWRWDQDAEGHAAVFDAVLCDNTTGHEVATWSPSRGGNNNGLRKRYTGANRPFTKTGSLVLSGDEYGDGVGWRLNREMEGSVLKWRIGGKVWLSYWPNEVDSSYFETRSVEWCDEVDLPLIMGKLSV